GIERAGNTVYLLWKSETAEPWERLEVDHERLKGADTKIYTNRHHLIKALRFGLGRLQLSDCTSPMRFSNGGRQMIVMPVRPDGAATDTGATEPQEQPTATPPSTANKERSTMHRPSSTN